MSDESISRRRFIKSSGALLALSVGTITGTTAQSASAASGRILRFSHTDHPGGSRDQAAHFFAEKIKKYTDSRYKVQVYPSGQLANDPQALQQMTLGGIDFTVTGTGTYAQVLRSLNLAGMPYLVDSFKQGWRFYDTSKWLHDQFSKLPAKGFRMLSTWEAGFRSITTTMPLHTPADASGKKIRIYPNDMERWTMDAIGFSPVVMPIPDVYLAIQQGTVSGQENPVDTIYSLRFYEVAPYITLTRHIYSPIPLAMSESTWKRLSKADKAVFMKAAKEASSFSRNLVTKDETKQLDKMKAKGATVSTPKIAAFEEAVKPVYAKTRKVYGEKQVDRILADAKAIRQQVSS